MNETLQKIMEFINNNTLILIGICVFLILVLIGYLIDNSVKSKRVRKDIKNAAQVPENIKDEIIKEAEEKKEVIEPVTNTNENVITNTEQAPMPEVNESINIETTPEVNNNVQTIEPINEVNSDAQEPVVEAPTLDEFNQPLDLDSTVNNMAPFVMDNVTPTEDLNTSLNLNSSITEPFSLDLNVEPKKEETVIDPDANIMNPVDENNLYTNDMKLSDILSNMNNQTYKKEETNIFANNNTNESNSGGNEYSDELDRIMRKLSSMNNNVEDDNYTNIF